jgi:hypothetical protein
LACVDEAHPGVVVEQPQDAPDLALGEAEDAAGQLLVADLEGALGSRVVARLQVEGRVHEAAAGALAAGEGVDPAHEVVGAGFQLLDLPHHLGQIARAQRLHAHLAAVHVLGPQHDAAEGAEHAEAADRRVEQVAVALAAGGDELAGGQHEVELEAVVADRPDLVVVLAVDVHGQRAGHGGEGRARHDRRPPAVGRMCFQSCCTVTPGSSTATPVTRSHDRMRFMRERSSTQPWRFTDASP